MLFPVPLWGFDRVHPSDIEAAVIRRLIKDCPNVAAIKAEGGMPSIMGFVECHRLFGKEIVVTCPLEADMVPLAQLAPMQFSGTSNTEYFGPTIPRIFPLLQEKQYDEATRLYWQIHPARKANQPPTPTWRRRFSSTACCGSSRAGSTASTAARCAARRCG